MNKKELKLLVREVLREFGHTTEKVAVEINGELDYYTEREIRALQIIAKRKGQESDEAFEEFCKSVTVYDRRTKRGAHKMIFRKDGRFDNSFEEGFFNITSDLALELF
jgi:hypothetical protein